MSSNAMKFTFYLLLLAISTLGCASSVRILDEVDPQPSTIPTTILPSGQFPAIAGATGATPVLAPVATTTSEPAPIVAPVDDNITPGDENVAPTATPAVPVDDDMAPVAAPIMSDPTTPDDDGVTPVVTPTTPAATSPDDDDDVAPIAAPTATSQGGPVSVGGATVAPIGTHPSISFFMHDILGGSHPSGRVVTGIVASSNVNNLPFSRPNNQILPINGGVPLNTVNGVINNNNAPLLVGLNGSPTTTVTQNSGNNNVVNGGGNNNLPFVSAGQLPAGLTLQQLMFGSVTVVDNELTEGHELDSAVIGSAQGFYLSSSLDGTSHTIVLTALFHGGDHHDEVDDTISFFGVHRTGSPVSEIVVVGGTGKYEDARGYATIEALPQHDQHTTDGVETITQFNVFITAP